MPPISRGGKELFRWGCGSKAGSCAGWGRTGPAGVGGGGVREM